MIAWRPSDHAPPSRRRLLRRTLVRDERGAVSAELVIATPLLLLLIMGVIQFALWQHAEHIASAVAQQGVAVGRLQGESAAAGQEQAQSVLHQLGSSVLVGSNITATRTKRHHDGDRHRPRREHRRTFLAAGQGGRHRTDRDLHQPGPGAMTDQRGRRWGRLHRDERGSVTVELVLLTPLLILLLLFVVALGRLSGARLDVDGAAAQAARAASIARDPTTATAMAQQTATAALGSDHVTCAQLTVTPTPPSSPPAARSRSPSPATSPSLT